MDALVVAVARVDPDADACSGFCPLRLEVVGRGNDRDAVDGTPLEELGREAQREGRLACTRSRRGKEVPRLGLEVDIEGLCLPGAQPSGRAPRGALRERRGEVLRGERADLVTVAGAVVAGGVRFLDGLAFGHNCCAFLSKPGA